MSTDTDLLREGAGTRVVSGSRWRGRGSAQARHLALVTTWAHTRATPGTTTRSAVSSSRAAWLYVEMAPSPISSVSNTSVTRMLARCSRSRPGPTSSSVLRLRTSLIFSPKPLSAMTRAAHSAMGRNSSQAVTVSAPRLAAIMLSSPVPVPMSRTCTGCPASRLSLTAAASPS